ncbi:hypothetical protein UF75_3799 [Desulfosporosinus sp. I2]|uniref:hypothetical protein n=1 Tax=Desulfosporosinus sp. I2 TaxID=1617025 RepID=UPI0005F00D4F|nr:hypothetical protein [Desulfosporosinus sp. I2]KJR45814.1 hypothetical protein UF75_3799 [Desulfosporosinus sp. I2]
MIKIKAMVILIALLIALSPSVVMAGGSVPAGVTLQGWSTTANNGGKSTMINLLYTDGFSTALQLDAPFDSSWHSLNDVRPILQAYKEGYGPNLSGADGILGTGINFAPNVLAAMKAQNFNPAQVGGANIPPSSTVLNDEQIAWLQRGGYPIPTQTTAPSTPTPVVKNDPLPEPAKPQPAPKQETQPVATKPITTALLTDSAPKADPADPVGQTVETPATPMTQEMIAESQKRAAENPPTINKPNIPLTEQTTEQEELFSNRNIWIGVALIVAVVTMVVVIYTKRKGKLA